MAPVATMARARRCPAPELFVMLRSSNGGPDRTRTCDLRFRKPLLYPAELRDRFGESLFQDLAF